jgi:hypothetical protein
MAIIDKGAILQARKRRVEKVETPEGTLFVRSLTVGEKSRYEAGNYTLKGGKPVLSLETAEARFAALVLSDEDGKRLFSDEDAAQLQHVEAGRLEPALKAARRLNGMTDESAEEARGNSSSAPSGASS